MIASPNGIVKRPALNFAISINTIITSCPSLEYLHKEGVKIEQVPHDRGDRKQGKDTTWLSDIINEARERRGAFADSHLATLNGLRQR